MAPAEMRVEAPRRRLRATRPRCGPLKAPPTGAARAAGGEPPAKAGAAGTVAAGPWINGHSVVGMMIYQGDNWPAEYRDRAYP